MMREVWTRHTDIPQKTPLATPRPKRDLGTSLTHNQVALVLGGLRWAGSALTLSP